MLTFLLGVAVALGSASAYSLGVILQSLEAREIPESESLRLSLLKKLIRRPRWLLGTGSVILGWVLQAAALALAPITVVQPALAVGLFVLLMAGRRLSDDCSGRREALAVVAITVGVIGLGFASPKESGDGHADWLVIAPALTLFAAVALTPYILRGRPHPLLVVIGAGVAYACSGFLTKFVADAVSDADAVAAAAWLGGTIFAAGLGLISEMTALQARSAIRVFPGVLVIQIVLAVLLAPVLAGEQLSTEPLELAVISVALAVLAAGTAVLASSEAVAAVIDTDADVRVETKAA